MSAQDINLNVDQDIEGHHHNIDPESLSAFHCQSGFIAPELNKFWLIEQLREKRGIFRKRPLLGVQRISQEQLDKEARELEDAVKLEAESYERRYLDHKREMGLINFLDFIELDPKARKEHLRILCEQNNNFISTLQRPTFIDKEICFQLYKELCFKATIDSCLIERTLHERMFNLHKPFCNTNAAKQYVNLVKTRLIQKIASQNGVERKNGEDRPQNAVADNRGMVQAQQDVAAAQQQAPSPVLHSPQALQMSSQSNSSNLRVSESNAVAAPSQAVAQRKTSERKRAS